MQKSKTKSFTKSAIILAIGSFLCKIIGAVYRVPLTNVLGARGIGEYQTVFPLFVILLTISSGGITQAISSLLSSADREEQGGLLKAGAINVGIISLIVGVFTFLLAPVFSYIQGVESATIGYKILAPIIILSGFSALLKGYFQSKSLVSQTTISNLIEQLVKLFVGLSLAIYLKPRGLTYAISGALIGSLIGELGSLLFLIISYFLDKNKPRISQQNPVNYDFLRVFRTVLPLSLGGLILPICALLDSISIVNVLTFTTGQVDVATSQYGMLSGMVTTLTNLPVVFTVALGVVVTPIISAQKRSDSVSDKANLSIKLALYLCIPISILMIALAKPIITFLYPNLSPSEQNLSASLLAISSLGVTALGVTQIYSSLLCSTGLSSKSTKNLAISALIKCVLTIPSLYAFGIYGACVVTVICYLCSAILNRRTWKKVFGSRSDDIKILTKIVFCSVLFCFPIYIFANQLNFALSIGLSALVMVLYLYTTIKLNVFSQKEKQSLPFLKNRRVKKEN